MRRCESKTRERMIEQFAGFLREKNAIQGAMSENTHIMNPGR